MVDKITLSSVTNLSNTTTSQNTINNNFAAIQTAFDNTLSRDGTQPNTMLSSLDMNGNRILNLPNPINGQEPVTLAIFNASLAGSGNVPAGGQVGFILMKNSSASFDTIWSPLTGFPSAGALTGTETTIGVQGGNNVQITTQSIANLAFTGSALSGLPAASTLNPSDLFYIVQGGVDKSASGALISSLAGLPLVGNGFTYTASTPLLNLSQTWNNAAVQFTAIKLNVTNTASLSTSKLLDLQLGGSSQLSVTESGNVLATNGSASAPSFSFLSNPNTGMYNAGSPTLAFVQSGSICAYFDGGLNLNIPNSGSGVYILNGAGYFAMGATKDVGISRSAQGTVFLMNPNALTTATGFQVSNTIDVTTGTPTNYERGTFDWTTTTNVLTIGTQKGGTGSTRNLQFTVGGSNVMDFGITIPNGWSMVATGGATGILNLYTGLNGEPASASFNDVVAGHRAILIGTLNGGNTSWGSIISSDAIYGIASVTHNGGDVAGNVDTAISRTAANVLEINTGTPGTLTGTYLHWGGQSRVTSDQSFTSTTTLANVSGLSVNVAAGRTYYFEAELSFTDAAAGGIQAAISGTATATNIIYDGWIVDSAANGIKGNAQATALGGAVASSTTTGTAGHVTIQGTITVNAAGTLTVQAAQNTSSGTATVVKRGSRFIVNDIA